MIPHDSGPMDYYGRGVTTYLCERTIVTAGVRVRVNAVLEMRGEEDEKHRSIRWYLLHQGRRLPQTCSTTRRRHPTSCQTQLLQNPRTRLATDISSWFLRPTPSTRSPTWSSFTGVGSVNTIAYSRSRLLSPLNANDLSCSWTTPALKNWFTSKTEDSLKTPTAINRNKLGPFLLLVLGEVAVMTIRPKL